MLPPLRSLAMPRWLLVLLVLFLVLGHVCELPAYASLARPSHGTAHGDHPAHDHPDQSQMSCEAVDVLATTGHVDPSPILDITRTVSSADPCSVRIASAPSDTATRLPGRPPLFLLYASLLI